MLTLNVGYFGYSCYDEASGDVVYVLTHAFKPASMTYFNGRLFCVGKGAMSVLDFTENTITQAQVGGSLLQPLGIFNLSRRRHPALVKVGLAKTPSHAGEGGQLTLKDSQPVCPNFLHNWLLSCE